VLLIGASVILVSGPTNCKVSNPLIQVINVVSAQEMYDACHDVYNDIDVQLLQLPLPTIDQKMLKQKNKRQQIIFQLSSKKKKIFYLWEAQDKSVFDWFCFRNRE
jgi:phosphopantothenoylcysteine decarboxylase/phosphopantothenate--cysteine ligase